MVSTQGALGAAATLVAAAFALSTLERWLLRRKPYELAWTLSLAMFAVASGDLWWATATGWNDVNFRIFFLFGAILNVPWLALGSIELLAPRRVGRLVGAVLALVSMFAVGVMTVAPLLGPVPSDPNDLPQGSELFGPIPRILAAVGSGVGALVVFGAALLSAWRLLRGRARSAQLSGPVAAPGRLALGNLLIAAGTLVLSGSGTLAGRLGELEAFEVTLLVGVSILFVGFLVATSASGTRAPSAGPVGPAGELAAPATAPSAQDAPEDLAAHAPR